MLLTFLFLFLDHIFYILSKIKNKYLRPSNLGNCFYSKPSKKYINLEKVYSVYAYVYKFFFIYSQNYINLKFIHIFKYLLYEYPLPIIIASIVKKGDIVIDIGALVGYYTIFFSKLVGKEGKVYAFEPEPRAFLILKNKAKRLKNVILERKAVGDKNARIKFYLDKSIAGSSVYKDAVGSYEACIEVDMISLDEYFRNLKDEIALIKMDVQGAEFLVLKGMKNLIKKVKAIIFEYWPDGLKAAGIEPIELFNLLKKYNFEIFYVDQNLNIINITNKIDVKDYINLIAINKELINKSKYNNLIFK
jgi:FkbM family methyltransferase